MSATLSVYCCTVSLCVGEYGDTTTVTCYNGMPLPACSMTPVVLPQGQPQVGHTKVNHKVTQAAADGPIPVQAGFLHGCSLLCYM